MSSGTVAHPIGLNLPPTDMNSPPRLTGLIFNPRLFAALAEINPFPVQQASTRILIIRGAPLLHFARPTVVGCLLLALDFPSTENNSGPRDSELNEYCPDQVDCGSMESTLELLERELRVEYELTLELLEPMLEFEDRRERPVIESLAFSNRTNGEPRELVLSRVSLLETSRRPLRRESLCLPLLSRSERSLDLSRSL